METTENTVKSAGSAHGEIMIYYEHYVHAEQLKETSSTSVKQLTFFLCILTGRRELENKGWLNSEGDGDFQVEPQPLMSPFCLCLKNLPRLSDPDNKICLNSLHILTSHGCYLLYK